MVTECVISWKAVALSTIEAEYMATVEASKKVLWLRGLIETFGVIQDSVQVHCGSESAIRLAKSTCTISGLSILM